MLLYIVILLLSLAWNDLAFAGGIHVAAQTGNLAQVKTLLKENPSLINSLDDMGATPLIQATLRNQTNTVAWLLENNADVDLTRGQYTALALASQHGYTRLVELLLANHANPNGILPLGYTALHYAVREGQTDSVKLLLAANAGVNLRDKDGATPLYLAALYNNHAVEVVELLLAYKADVNARNSNRKTPLHVAARESNKDVVALLLANRADVNARDNNGDTPLHKAAAEEFSSDKYKAVVELLSTYNADINVKNKKGDTPLHLAVSNQKKDMAKLLRQHGGKD